jgi:outer membrane protein OmpA-like peptidoglycan-associated protein
LSTFTFSQVDTNSYPDEPPSFPIVIHYQNNSAQISHVSKYKLILLSDYLIQNPTINIVIEGHVCCGPALHMSKKRAKSIYKMLIRYDVPREQMVYIGKSFDEPRIAKEKSESDKDINRRVEIKLQ